MAETYDVLVIGGGVIGMSIAYYCAQQRWRVCVLEQGRVGKEASWAGAGMLTAARVRSARSSSSALLAKSCEVYPELSRQLLEETGIDNGYRRTGGLELGFDDNEAHMLASAAGHYNREGVRWEPLSVEQAREIEPALRGEFRVAYHVPDMAQIRNPRHLQALHSACLRRGVSVREGCPVWGFDQDRRTVMGVRSAAGRIQASTTVLAAGAWSGNLLADLNLNIPIKPVRGQIALLRSDPGRLRHILVLGRRYIVPRPDGRVLIGSTEENVGFNKEPTPAGIRGLLDLALAITPDLGEAELESSWAGLRPSTPDGRPYIGEVPGCDGVLVAAGHYRSGLQLSPATAILIKQMINRERPMVKVEYFALDRTGQL